MELQCKPKFTSLLWTERTFISSFWKDFIQMFVLFGCLQLAQAECLCLRSDQVWNNNSFIVWVQDRISAYLILPSLYTLREFAILQTQLNLHLCLGSLIDLKARIEWILRRVLQYLSCFDFLIYSKNSQQCQDEARISTIHHLHTEGWIFSGKSGPFFPLPKIKGDVEAEITAARHKGV